MENEAGSVVRCCFYIVCYWSAIRSKVHGWPVDSILSFIQQYSSKSSCVLRSFCSRLLKDGGWWDSISDCKKVTP